MKEKIVGKLDLLKSIDKINELGINYMKKLLLIFFILLFLCGTSNAEYFSDIIVTSPNGIWTDSRTYSTLNDAVAAVGANKRTIVIANQQVVTSLTIPSNITLKLERDGSITNSGQLTINTKNILAPDRQIFTGVGNIDFAAGSVIRSSWFSNLETALALTTNDTVTLLISKPHTITASYSVGTNVRLKWEAPGNLLTINPAITLSNISQVEAGDYQIFAGAGKFTFIDGMNLNLNWFAHFRSAITHADTTKVTITIPGIKVIDYSDSIPDNTTLDLVSRSGFLNLTAGVTLSNVKNIIASNVPIFSTTGSITGLTEAKPEWWGAITSLIDATPLIDLATASLGTKGGKLILDNTYLIDTDLTIPYNVTAKCNNTFIGLSDATNLSTMNALMVNQTETISLTDGAGIDGCLIYRKGISFPTVDSTGFNGTAITGEGNDIFVINSMILGFDTAVYSINNDRVIIKDVKGDNVNGIDLQNCMDICKIENTHFWPFSIYPNAGNYKRSGTAFQIKDGGDWVKITNSFSWGYEYGFIVDNANSVTLLGCGADSPTGEVPDGIGFYIKTGSIDTRLIGCQSAGFDHAGVVIDTGDGIATKLSDMDIWNTGEHGVLVISGDVSLTSSTIRDVDAGVTTTSTLSKILIDQVTNLADLPVQDNSGGSTQIITGAINTGAGWTLGNIGGGSGSGTGIPGGLDTYVQFNDGGVLGGDVGFTWNNLTKLLGATSIDTHGMSVSGTSAGGGNLVYLNGYNGFTGNIISGNLNSAAIFWFDYLGGLELKGTIVLANNKALASRNNANDIKDLIYMGTDNQIKVGDTTAAIKLLPFSAQTGYLYSTDGLLSVSSGTGGGTGIPGGNDTYVQFNDAGAFGGDSTFTWNNTSKLLTAFTMSSFGLSLTGTGSDNTLYINNETGATGKLINGNYNSTPIFWFDYLGGLELKDTIVLANTKALAARDTSNTIKDIIYIANDNKIKIGDTSATLVLLPFSTETGYVYSTNGELSVTAGGGESMVYPGAGVPISTGSAWGTSSTLLQTIAGLTPTNGYVIKGNGSTWTSAAEATGSPAGSGTYVQFNSAGAFGGDSGLTWNNTSKILGATSLATHGLSVTGTVIGPGNLSYFNGYTGFTGNLLDMNLNSAHRFWVDYTGSMELTGSITLANTKQITARNTSGTAKDLIYLGSDNKIKIGDTSATITVRPFESSTGYMYVTAGQLSVTSGAMVYPGAGIPLSTGSAWGTSITNNSANWNTAYTDRLKWSGISTDLNVATARTSLGMATTDSPYFNGLNITGTIEVTGSSYVRVPNTTGVFAGKTTGGTTVNIASVGSDNILYIGAANASVPVRIGSGSSLANPVSIRVDSSDANVTGYSSDSCGVGYKCLRVPN